MVDGQIGIDEWKDAKNIAIDVANSLLMKEDQQYYYLAVKSNLTKPLYVDLFFQIRDSLINVHASSQSGQRYLPDTNWTDSEPVTNWGYNKGWVANDVKFDSKKIENLRAAGYKGDIYTQSFIPYNGMEFQFDKHLWNLEKCLLRVEIRNMTESVSFKTVAFPLDSERKNISKWYLLKWD